MSTQHFLRLGLVAAVCGWLPCSDARAAEVLALNQGYQTFDVAISLTSPGFRTERDGIIRRGQDGKVRVSSNISDARPWDLIVWKRAHGQSQWRFSTAFRIPSENLNVDAAMAILNIDPERDRVSLVYAAPGPEGMEAIPNISPWLQGNDGGQAPRPQPRARLGVQAYKCQHGMHVQSVVVGSPATHCVNNQTGVAVSLKTNDHILAVNGVAPRNITEFQSLIRQSPRTVSLTVRDAYTQQTRVLTTNLW